jgi:hypothetical protein
MSHFILGQTATLGGILLGHGLEEIFHLRDPKPFGHVLAESGALLACFGVMNRVTPWLFGRRFHNTLERLELKSRALLAEGPRWNFDLPNLSPQSAIAGAAFKNPSTKAGEFILLSENNGDKKNITGVFSVSKAPSSPLGKDPFRVDSVTQMMNRMRDPKLGFLSALIDHDITFFLEAEFKESVFLPPLLSYLNVLATRNSIPLGRMFVLKINPPGGEPQTELVLTRKKEGFTKLSPFFTSPEASPSSPLSGTGKHVLPEFKDTIPRFTPRNPTPLPEPSVPETIGFNNIPDLELTPPPKLFDKSVSSKLEAKVDLPLIAERPEALPTFVRTSNMRAKPGKIIPIILKGFDFDIESAKDSLVGLEDTLVEGAIWKIYIPVSKQTAVLTNINHRIEIKFLNDPLWANFETQKFLTNLFVRKAEELYLEFALMGENPDRTDDVVTKIKFYDKVLSRKALAEFVLQGLKDFQVKGKEFILELSKRDENLYFEKNQEGTWGQIFK